MKKEVVRNIVLVDIDGTVSKVGERVKYLSQTPPDWDSFYNDRFDDEPVMDIINLVQTLWANGYKIVFCTSRRESCRAKTVKWISKYFTERFCEDYKLLMRGNDDKRRDVDIKPWLLHDNDINLNKIYIVIEDRNVMVAKWRELGLTCLHVADVNF